VGGGKTIIPPPFHPIPLIISRLTLTYIPRGKNLIYI